MQGLEDAISVTVTHPTWQRTKPDTDDEHTGWAFAGPNDPPFTSSTGEQPVRSHCWSCLSFPPLYGPLNAPVVSA